MATYLFTATQNAVTGLNYISLEDKSTGDLSNLTGRRVYFRLHDGSFLKPAGVTTDYVEWPLPSLTIQLDILKEDTITEIEVVFQETTNVSVKKIFAFTGLSEKFLYELSVLQAGNIEHMPEYFVNKTTLRTLLDMVNESINIGADIFAANNLLDGAKYMIDKKDLFF